MSGVKTKMEIKETWKQVSFMLVYNLAMLPTVPSSWIAMASALAGLLCIFSVRKVHNMVRSSLVQMVQAGFALLAPALISFSILYYYFTNFVDDIDIQRAYLRFVLFDIFLILDLWQLILLKWGKNL